MIDEIDFRSRDPSVVSLFVHEDLGVVVHDARTGFNPMLILQISKKP